jgi:hypothetical protein
VAFTDRDWDTILYGIESDECILALGPELPVGAPDGPRRVAIDLLIERLLQSLGEEGAATKPTALPQIAQRYLASPSHAEIDLEREVKRWHQSLIGQRSAIYDDLAALPFRLILSSGHDPLMETALTLAEKPASVEWYNYRGVGEELLRTTPTRETPVLYHLHGHVRDPSSLVLTETQLLDYLVALIAKAPPLPNDLSGMLAKGRLFLFLGFGLRQWYLRILLHVLKILKGSSRTFALETLAETGDGPFDDTVLFYRDNFRFDIHRLDVVEFVSELRDRFGAAKISVESQRTPLASPTRAAQRPTVFICHASEDAAKALEVHQILEEIGAEPWVDKRSLRGGDGWDSLIESEIRNVDYFVVLNSEALVTKSLKKSYVNKEIKVALRAADLFAETFIIPIIIDNTPLRSEIQEYHAVDLRHENGRRDLIRAIKRRRGAA